MLLAIHLHPRWSIFRHPSGKSCSGEDWTLVVRCHPIWIVVFQFVGHLLLVVYEQCHFFSKCDLIICPVHLNCLPRARYDFAIVPLVTIFSFYWFWWSCSVYFRPEPGFRSIDVLASRNFKISYKFDILCPFLWNTWRFSAFPNHGEDCKNLEPVAESIF